MTVCVIPARGGSKRIPRKNIRSFHGRPLIEWPIEVARRSGLFDRVVVSTDDDEIASIAEAAGAEIPFRRSAALADDHATTNAVIADAAHRLGLADDEVLCGLYPTAPFVQATHLQAGADALVTVTDARFSFSATTFPFPVQRALVVGDDAIATPMFPEHVGSRSQDLVEAIHDAGQFYWGRVDAFRAYPVLFDAPTTPVLLPRTMVQDIDTPDDWSHAEALFAVLGRDR